MISCAAGSVGRGATFWDIEMDGYEQRTRDIARRVSDMSERGERVSKGVGYGWAADAHVHRGAAFIFVAGHLSNSHSKQTGLRMTLRETISRSRPGYAPPALERTMRSPRWAAMKLRSRLSRLRLCSIERLPT